MTAFSLLSSLAPTLRRPPRQGTVPGSINLTASIPADGTVDLSWTTSGDAPSAWWLLAIRTGARPGYSGVRLDAATRAYRFNHLGRHQRYRFLVVGTWEGQRVCSSWLSTTPRAGSAAQADEAVGTLAGCTGSVTRLLVMPQDKRITLFWTLAPGFIERVVVQLCAEGRTVGAWEVEPEVRSMVLDAARVPALVNGTPYTVRVSTRFAGHATPAHEVTCTTAPQGRERDANKNHPQQGLIFACLALDEELDVFNERTGTTEARQAIPCGHCGKPTAWRDWALRCTGCSAEFIGNGRGDFLDMARLRFGTCRCCLPRRILVQDAGSDSLRCAHSSKEYVRVPGQAGWTLIEDLPFGLCQCCRPRRPLQRAPDGNIRCMKSNEVHRRDDGDTGSYILVPTTAVFDAAAIDDLLDAGLADICASGVSRARRH